MMIGCAIAANCRRIGRNMGTGLLGKICSAGYEYRHEGDVYLVRVVARLPDNTAAETGRPKDQLGRWHVIERDHTNAQIENTHMLACKLFIEHEHAELMNSGTGGPSPFYPRH